MAHHILASAERFDSVVTGRVVSVNEKGLKLEGHDEERERKRAQKRASYLKNREREILRKRARYQENREAERARAAARHLKNPEPARARAAAQRARLGKEAIAASNKEYRRQNAERLRAAKQVYYQENRPRLDAANTARRRAQEEAGQHYLRAYYAANRERHAALSAQYKRENKDAVAFWNRRRDIAKRGTPVNDLTRPQWAALKLAYGQRCAYCGNTFDRLTQDHVIPLSRHGSHTARNIVPACRPCNARKFTGPPLPLAVLPLWSDLVPAIWSQS